MGNHEVATLIRDCEATKVPEGGKITLPKGTEVQITQSLGGTFTVITDGGFMVSIAGKDADALGKKGEDASGGSEADSKTKSVDERVWDKLRQCYDPEIPHNIVDLGLIYNCDISDVPDAKKKVHIKMTLTAPGCGMGDWLKQDVQQKLQGVSGVGEVHIEMVFDPPWDPSKVDPELKPYLGL